MTRKKILLVDDSNTILMMEKMMLSQSEFDVVVAHNGEEAVSTATKERPDLILLDIVMPEMNGFEACKRIRESTSLRDVPIIMVTTRGEATNVRLGYDSGCTAYITKPFKSTQLLATIRSHLK